MDANPPPDPPEAPASQRYGLFIAALVASLLGLTTADVTSTPAAKQPRADVDERSAEYIVASAVFAGVHPAP